MPSTAWKYTPGPTVNCSRSDPLAAGAAYPSITVTVHVAPNAAPSLINTSLVSGGGVSTLSHNPPTSTLFPYTTLFRSTINKSHSGNPTQGQVGFTYTLTASNVGASPTSG